MVNPHDQTISFSEQEVIDRLADQFEKEFNAGQRPRIEDFLDDYGGDRLSLLRELLTIEIELRGKSGSEIQVEEYIDRFPNGKSIVKSVLAKASVDVRTNDYIAEFKEYWKQETSVTAEAFVTVRGIACSADEFEQLLKEESSLRLKRFGGTSAKTDLPSQIGRYEIVKLISEGGFGTVYEAIDPKLDRPVAIKTPRVDRPLTNKGKEDFEGEAKLICRLEHPNILPVYDFGTTEDELPYIVMKLATPDTLQHRIARSQITFFEATSIVAKVARALHHAHGRGVTHRDVKPGNVLLGDDDHPWLTDFGLGLESPDVERSYDASGTPLYWSPEQAEGKSHLVDGRSDIFSLGIVLYHALTGTHPFQADSVNGIVKRILHADVRPPRQINDRIPKPLEEICLKSLRRNTLERYTTAEDMADDLEAVPSYTPQPIDTRHIEFPPELQALVETLAINTHEIWAAKRLKEGWIVGAKRDDKKKTHPDLVPFEQLTKTEQDYDRDVVESVLKAAITLGSEIQSPDP